MTGASTTTPPSSNSVEFGFVGTGEITSAIVEGINSHNAEPPTIFLSPRSRAVADELAGRFANVRVCRSNQDVLDRVTSIVLAVPPQSARNVLEELSFQPQHVLMSAVAGLRLHQLRDLAAPAGHSVRVIPLPQAAHCQSLTTIYPDSTVARDLFDQVGRSIVPAEEEALDALSAATATFAAHLDYLATIIGWLADHGIDRTTATTFITHLFSQLGISLSKHDNALVAMTDKHTSPGGINEQLMTELRNGNVPNAVRCALDQVLARLRS